MAHSLITRIQRGFNGVGIDPRSLTCAGRVHGRLLVSIEMVHKQQHNKTTHKILKTINKQQPVNKQNKLKTTKTSTRNEQTNKQTKNIPLPPKQKSVCVCGGGGGAHAPLAPPPPASYASDIYIYIYIYIYTAYR